MHVSLFLLLIHTMHLAVRLYIGTCICIRNCYKKSYEMLRQLFYIWKVHDSILMHNLVFVVGLVDIGNWFEDNKK